VTEDQALGQRLQTLIDEVGMSQTALAQLIGLKQGYINQIFRGHKRISSTAIFAIAKRFENLNIRWLLLGSGTMWILENYYPPPEIGSGALVIHEPPPGYDPAADPPTDIYSVLRDHEQRLRTLESGK
jgi:transcriptional regulator with XRE-family HTH domain